MKPVAHRGFSFPVCRDSVSSPQPGWVSSSAPVPPVAGARGLGLDEPHVDFECINATVDKVQDVKGPAAEGQLFTSASYSKRGQSHLSTKPPARCQYAGDIYQQISRGGSRMMGGFGRFRDINLVFLRQKQVTSASGDHTWHCPVPGVQAKAVRSS